jgi:NitT/TauT family transport system substrate-binding protein
MADNVTALAEGRLDLAQLFEPFVEQAIAAGSHIWYQASARGRTAYTVFVTTRDRLVHDPEPFRRMTRAIYRAQRWVATQSPDALVAAIADYFPALDRGVLAPALQRYRAQGVWAADPICSQAGFEQLRRALLGSGFLRRAVEFAECAEITLAQEVVARSSAA